MDKKRSPSSVIFYLYFLFSHLLPLYAVYILLINQQLKSEFYTGVLIAIWAFTVVILEIPSGVLADFWNKKHVLIIGQMAKVLACLIWLIASSFIQYAVGFVLWGMSESFSSGSIEALLYEDLEQFGMEEKYQRISGMCRFLMIAGIVGAYFSGSFLYMNGTLLIFVISISTSLLTVLISLYIPHHRKGEVTYHPENFIKTLFDAVRQIFSSALLIRMIFYSMIYLTVIGVIEEFLQLWLFELKISGLNFGGILTLVMINQMIGAGLSSLIIVKKRMELFLFSGMLFSGTLLIIGYFNNSASIVAMIIVFLITGLMEAKCEAYVQEKVCGQRSTIFSIHSCVMNFSGIFLALVLGSIGEVVSYRFSFLVMGSFVAITSVLLFLSIAVKEKTLL